MCGPGAVGSSRFLRSRGSGPNAAGSGAGGGGADGAKPRSPRHSWHHWTASFPHRLTVPHQNSRSRRRHRSIPRGGGRSSRRELPSTFMSTCGARLYGDGTSGESRAIAGGYREHMATSRKDLPDLHRNCSPGGAGRRIRASSGSVAAFATFPCPRRFSAASTGSSRADPMTGIPLPSS